MTAVAASCVLCGRHEENLCCPLLGLYIGMYRLLYLAVVMMDIYVTIFSSGYDGYLCYYI